MSGFAMFGLKYAALLKFDEAYQTEAVIRANLWKRAAARLQIFTKKTPTIVSACSEYFGRDFHTTIC
jgi:hypothetical protein